MGNLVNLKDFSLFSDYFCSISIIYLLITFVILTHNVFKLMLQKAISECMACICLMSCYLIVNDDLLSFNLLGATNIIKSDEFVLCTKLMVSSFVVLYFFLVSRSLKEQKLISFEYLIFVLFAVLGLLVMCSSNDLLITYLTIELASLAFYVLAAFKKMSNYSVESGLKYFITGIISSAFFLVGGSFIYGMAGSVVFSDLSILLDNSVYDYSQMHWEVVGNTLTLEAIAGPAMEMEISSCHSQSNNYFDFCMAEFSKKNADAVERDKDNHRAANTGIQSLLDNINIRGCNSCEHLKEYEEFFKKDIDAVSSGKISEAPESIRKDKSVPLKKKSQVESDAWEKFSKKNTKYIHALEEHVRLVNFGKSIADYIVVQDPISGACLNLHKQHVKPFFDYNFLEIGLTLILFSLFVKLALAPFHLWSLNVYEGSPTSSTVFFAVITKLSFFTLLVRLCYFNSFYFQESWKFYSIWVGIFSVFVGSFGGLKQRKFKTLLAYSSINHMGYSLIAFSTNTTTGVQMLLFYMIIYMISGLVIWSIFLFLRIKKNNSSTKYNKELGDFVLLKKSNSVMAFALSVTLFSMAGIPPMIGFIAKMNVFLSIIEIKYYIVSLITILFSVVSTFYYLRIIKILYFENLLVGKLYYSTNSEKILILSVLIFLLIFLFLNPTLLYLFTFKAVLLSEECYY